MNISWPEILIILLVILLLFGAKRLPELARGFGEAIREFTKSRRDITTTDMCQSVSTPPAPAEPPTKLTQTPSVPPKPDDPKLS